MAGFRVTFFNDLCDSTGHDHRCCQREIELPQAVSAERAIEQAKREFERLERVERWHLRATGIRCDELAPGKSAVVAP